MNETLAQILEMVRQPAFLVCEDLICWHNGAAQGLLQPDAPIGRYFDDLGHLYKLWNRKGTLQIPLTINGDSYEASVQATADGDLFVASRKEPAQNEGALTAIQAAISLRRPLTALRTAAEGLFEELESHSALQLGSEMNRALYQLRRLSEQMFDGGRLLLHRRQAQRSLTDLREFTRDFLSQLRPIIETDGWHLEAVLPREPLTGAIDRNLLEQALLNLLSNALLHTRRGGKVRVELQQQGHFILFHVDDSGEGMDRNSHISAEQSMDPRKGIGFGLQIVQEVARLHGGALTIAGSGPEGGVRASISILPESAVLELRTSRLSFDRSTVGERGLIALSDALSAELYNTDDIQA